MFYDEPPERSLPNWLKVVLLLFLVIATLTLVFSTENPISSSARKYGDYLLDRFKNGYRFDVPVAVAVDRSVLLPAELWPTLPDVDRAQTFRNQTDRSQWPKWNSIVRQLFACDPHDISPGIDTYVNCKIASGADDRFCGRVFVRKGCRAIAVSELHWQHEPTRKKIVAAALDPCRYLPVWSSKAFRRDRREYVSEQDGTKKSFALASMESPGWYRGAAGCDAANRDIRVTEVYVEVFHSLWDKKPLAVYHLRNGKDSVPEVRPVGL